MDNSIMYVREISFTNCKTFDIAKITPSYSLAGLRYLYYGNSKPPAATTPWGLNKAVNPALDGYMSL